MKTTPSETATGWKDTRCSDRHGNLKSTLTFSSYLWEIQFRRAESPVWWKREEELSNMLWHLITLGSKSQSQNFRMNAKFNREPKCSKEKKSARHVNSSGQTVQMLDLNRRRRRRNKSMNYHELSSQLRSVEILIFTKVGKLVDMIIKGEWQKNA